MLYRYRLNIQYDGAKFFGWQLQKNKRTVQGVIEEALKLILKSNSRIPVHGSGRTDKGVHAWGQVAHADMDIKMGVQSMVKATNGNLSNDIEILDIIRVENQFHARFNATKRCYRYQFYSGKSLLFNNQTWHMKSLNLELLNTLSIFVLGEHNFLSFSKFNKEKINTFCTIFTSSWKVENNITYYKIEGNRFLHHMVRYLVGTMLAVNNGNISIEDFKRLISYPSKNVHIFKAPPKGLILEKVFYD